MNNAQHTDQECHLCEDGHYIRLEHEKVCDECHHSPARTRDSGHVTEWEYFWQHRRDTDEYEGFTGPSRVKMVGGFAGPYVYSEGIY